MMNLREKYPNLFQLFVGYFADADFENLTDQEVILNYILDCNKSKKSRIELANTIEELDLAIVDIEKSWNEVSFESNRYFENSSQVKVWLKMIKQGLVIGQI